LHRLDQALADGFGRDALEVGRVEATARVLLALEPGEGIPMGEMARRLARDPSTATRFVDRAVREGLAVRGPGEVDRRCRLVALTAEGETLRGRLMSLREDRAQKIHEEVQGRTGLGPGQVDWFLQTLVEAVVSAPAPASGPASAGAGSPRRPSGP
jgi:DNA-binding MarR family transcriptional regulator